MGLVRTLEVTLKVLGHGLNMWAEGQCNLRFVQSEANLDHEGWAYLPDHLPGTHLGQDNRLRVNKLQVVPLFWFWHNLRICFSDPRHKGLPWSGSWPH